MQLEFSGFFLSLMSSNLKDFWEHFKWNLISTLIHFSYPVNSKLWPYFILCFPSASQLLNFSIVWMLQEWVQWWLTAPTRCKALTVQWFCETVWPKILNMTTNLNSVVYCGFLMKYLYMNNWSSTTTWLATCHLACKWHLRKCCQLDI